MTEPDPWETGDRLARGLCYGLAFTALLAMAVMAILWWAL